MTTRIVTAQIAPPQETAGELPPTPSAPIPHLGLAMTLAASGLALYISSIVWLNSLMSFLFGTGMMVLALAVYIGAMIDAYAKLTNVVRLPRPHGAGEGPALHEVTPPATNAPVARHTSVPAPTSVR